MERFERPNRRCLVAIKAMAPCLSTTASFAVPAPADDRDTFVYTFECSVVELLNRIHPHPHMKAVDHRFLVLAPKDRGASYVQCAFDGDDRDLMCEAASGFYDKRGRRAHFSQARRQALARLGFSTDGSHGNFQRLFNIRNTDMHREVADLLLGALFDGYGVRMNETIEVVAPFALKHGMLSRDRCVPVS